MAHLLLVELPGGNDTDLVQAALAEGHAVSFLTSDLGHYRRQPEVWAELARAGRHLEVAGFEDEAVARRVLELHLERPVEAVLCAVDIRIVAAARLARRLGLRHLAPETAELMRDKYRVRRRLADRGVTQPEFALATRNDEVRAAVERLGLPVIIKPADGYGSQNIVVLRDPEDLAPWMSPLDNLLPSRADYGLGVRANDRLLVERYMAGRFVGCDTFSADGCHRMMGLHEKLMYAPPSFALRGSTFVPDSTAFDAVREHVFAALDAVDFRDGAAHIELMLTDRGPRIVEINPRLVGAKMPRMVGRALDRSLHRDLIELHLNGALPAWEAGTGRTTALRWIVADRAGVLRAVEGLPAADDRVAYVEVLKRPGDRVRPPLENADRIGYVVTCAASRGEAEALADRCVADARAIVDPAH